MYHAHFGLTKALFDPGIAQEAGVYLGERQRAALAQVKTALTPLGSALLLLGPAGVGKTTLASAAVRAASTRLALGWLTSPPAHAPELLEMLLAEFGLSAHRATRAERLQMWRQFLNEMSATESRVIVLVEHCEDHSTDALRALESLTAPDPNGGLGANLVLLGGRDVGEHLQPPALDALRQRVRLRQRVEPLDAAELHDYLAHHAALAGGTVDALFEPSAVAALVEHSGGLPRMVNNLCETALELAAAAAQKRVDGSLLRKVAVEIFGLEPAVPTATVTAAYAVAAAQPPIHAATTSAPPAAPSPSSVPSTNAADAKPLAAARSERVVAAQEPGQPPVVATAKPAPLQRALPQEPRLPWAGDATDVQDEGENIVLASDDSFATTTIVDEPEVPMADFPVLTDAVPGTGRPAPAAWTALPTARTAAAPAAPAEPAPARDSRQAAAAAAAPRAAPVQRVAPAIAAAELDLVSAALAATAWTDDDLQPVAPPAVASPPALDDPFDLFDLGSDAPLELIDDTHAAPKAGARR
jgi:general secretion pathway protein A